MASEPTYRLLIRVALGRGQVLAQFVGRAPWTIAGRIALDAPAFLQWTGIDRIESELGQGTG